MVHPGSVIIRQYCDYGHKNTTALCKLWECFLTLFYLINLQPYEDKNTGMIFLSLSKNEDLRFRKII